MRSGFSFTLLCLVCLFAGRPATAATRDTHTFTIATANLSDNTSQAYEGPGMRILKALKPDIVGIQEFTYKVGTPQDFVRHTFGPDFYFWREKDAPLPNGIISRYPILASGQWEDPFVSNRDFAWATLAIPGPKRLHVVSVHLVQNRTNRRIPESRHLVERIAAHFPTNDYVVLCGDFNISSRQAPVMDELAGLFADDHHPADQHGNPNTNTKRIRPYDFVLPNYALAPYHIPTRLATEVFPHGLVFDSRLWDPVPPPAEREDSGRNMQHMPVMKTYRIPVY
ncbi:MAG: endonuclease/exonuclease/phosphatase family protein [Verrucomicrobiota bacterium]|jgi:endonuclease/exonuclease/phosphatase family metal-dependent hydrolase|nr:endonuclease/exonuclease/phosphatase family protein [Verrucomicrobiota bacterium]